MTTYLQAEELHLTPVELYTFTIQDTVYRYTDSEISVAHPVSGLVYEPEPISRSDLQQSEEDQSVVLQITMDSQSDIGEFFRQPFLSSRSVWILVERMHLDAPGEIPAPVFRGLVTQCVFQDAQATLSCVPTRMALTREIPIILVQSLCSNTLYDERCKADPTLTVVNGTVAAIAGTVLTVTEAGGFADGFFSGGYVVQGTLPPATVRDHVGQQLFLLYNFDFALGPILLYPGCDKKLSTCQDKFNNTINYQGFPRMPLIDPFVDSIN